MCSGICGLVMLEDASRGKSPADESLLSIEKLREDGECKANKHERAADGVEVSILLFGISGADCKTVLRRLLYRSSLILAAIG